VEVRRWSGDTSDEITRHRDGRWRVETNEGPLDAAQAGDPRSQIYTYSLLIIASGVVKGVMMLFRRWLAGRLSLAVEYDLRNRMYGHMQRLSYRFFDRHQTGQLLSRATVDVQAVRVFLGYGLIFFFQHTVTVVGLSPAACSAQVGPDPRIRDRARPTSRGARASAPRAAQASG
jgi:ABC-type multidrug transport system fused ATPase/permease subunit